jgi:hypothetical protein
MGAQRRQHHRQQEAMRAANAEANRRRAEMEEANRRFQEQLKMQREAMEAQTKAMQEAMAPDVRRNVGGTLGAQNLGVRTSRSRRQSVANIGRGISSLRIPLNIGTESGSGLNIG